MATENTFFKNLRSGAEGRWVSGDVGKRKGPNFAIKAAHSARDFASSIDKTTFGRKAKTPNDDISGGNSRLQVGFKAADYTMNTVAATTLVISSIAAAGIAGAFITAMTGPIAGVVLGIIGLIVLAKAAYSDRESCHEKLEKYCWSMIDDKEPQRFATSDELFAASSAALELLSDGKSQIAELGNKLQKASDKLRNLHDQIRAREAILKMTGTDVVTINRLNKENKDSLEKAMKRGGAIYDYVRRVVHTATYVQAPYIAALAMKEKLQPGVGLSGNSVDYFANMDVAIKSRQLFTQMAEFYETMLNADDVDASTMADRKSKAANNINKVGGVKTQADTIQAYKKP